MQVLEILKDLWFAIAAGLATAGLVALWSRRVLPWFDRTIRIEGVWKTTIAFPDGAANTHRIHLKRTFHSVRGEAVCEEGWGKGLRYKLTGTFKNLLLTARYESLDERRFERGTLTLRLEEGGSVLRGHLAYFDNERNQTSTVACHWRAESAPDFMGIPVLRASEDPGGSGPGSV